jgi:hypothetical protein
MDGDELDILGLHRTMLSYDLHFQLVISLSSSLTFSTHVLNYWRFPLSFLSFLTCSSNSLIHSSFSLFFRTISLRFYYVGNMKAMLTNVVESGSFLTYFFTIIFVTTDKGLPTVTGSFLVCHCTIFSVTLLNTKFFIFPTLLGL